MAGKTFPAFPVHVERKYNHSKAAHSNNTMAIMACVTVYIDELMQKRRYSIALAMELRHSCANLSTL